MRNTAGQVPPTPCRCAHAGPCRSHATRWATQLRLALRPSGPATQAARERRGPGDPARHRRRGHRIRAPRTAATSAGCRSPDNGHDGRNPHRRHHRRRPGTLHRHRTPHGRERSNSNAYARLGDAGTPECDAATTNSSPTPQDWVRRIQPVLDQHPVVEPYYFKRSLQRYIDDQHLIVVDLTRARSRPTRKRSSQTASAPTADPFTCATAWGASGRGGRDAIDLCRVTDSSVETPSEEEPKTLQVNVFSPTSPPQPTVTARIEA